MTEKEWRNLEKFLKESGIDYQLRPVSIFRGVTCYEILLPLVESGAVND